MPDNTENNFIHSSPPEIQYWASSEIEVEEDDGDEPCLPPQPISQPVSQYINTFITEGKFIRKTMKQEELSLICLQCDKKLIEGKDCYWTYGFKGVNAKNQLFVICATCLPLFKQCVCCGRHFREKELQLGHCDQCIENAPHQYIHNYKYKVEKDFAMIGKPPKDQIYYGVELELESENLGLDVLIVNSLIKNFACLKRDSSIKHGFEIVSAPAIIEEHYHIWDEFFTKLPATCHPLKSCGMHVHASRERMSDLQIGKILEFLHNRNNQEFIKLIAGREKPVFLGNGKGYHELEPKKIADMKVPIDRHSALNLNNGETIEFRIFWATRDKRIFLKNIEFCRAMIKWTDWATTSIQDSIDYRRFIEFVKRNRKDYEYLCLFFETPSMKRLLEL